jgi:Tfp pilus assembly protein PilV
MSAERRPGFSLVENLIALIILTVAILASFQTIAFALSVTTEARGRMKSYAQLEQFGLSAASGENAGTTVTSSDVQVPVLIDGARNDVTIKKVVCQYAPDAFPSQKMKSPVVVVFRAK